MRCGTARSAPTRALWLGLASLSQVRCGALPSKTTGADGAGAERARVGAELCPAGPFESPVSAPFELSKLASVGVEETFNFEGAVWIDDALYLSEIREDGMPRAAQIDRLRPGGPLERGVIVDSGSNGLAVDADGNLIAATHDVGGLSRFSLTSGERQAFGAQTFGGVRFNSPNDLVLRGDGNAYFTDPPFMGPDVQGASRVYRIAPDGRASVVDDTLINPNGITLSPDGNTLYVTAETRFMRYPLREDGSAGQGVASSLAEPITTPDGMTVDCAGNVYTTEFRARRIRVFDAEGSEMGQLGDPTLFEENVTNLAFGGPAARTLFVTTLTRGTRGGVYAVELPIPGLPY